MPDFKHELNRAIAANLNHNYPDNFLVGRFGREKAKSRFKRWLTEIAIRIGLLSFVLWKKKTLITSFNYLYDRLNDEYSRSLLIQVLTYRLLGYRKVKLPLNDGEYFSKVDKIDRNVIDPANSINTNFKNWKLSLFDLEEYGFPDRVFSTKLNIYHTFIYPEYQYNGKDIKAQTGDVVIDAGACWGDTAVYFSKLVGPTGRVYSFEFLPENIRVLSKNAEINKPRTDNIEIIERPIWSTSNVTISSNNLGPGNKVILGKSDSDIYQTISLDDFAIKKGISKVDFIKMDIEGAELEALKGARKIIAKYKPTLAICVYHKADDCYKITQFIESLNLGYRFYFDHFSIHGEESVLFAQPVIFSS